MIIAIDANALIHLVNERDTNDFCDFFRNNSTKLALFSPVIAEFLVFDDSQEKAIFLAQSSGFCEQYTFDFISATISAEITRRYLQEIGKSKVSKNKTWQGTKIDSQIVAIAIANRIPKIITDDANIKKMVKNLGLEIEVISLSDIQNQQPSLF